jgi:hypothetical protein
VSDDLMSGDAMDFSIDFTNVETRNFDPMPLGKYLVAVTDFEAKECGPNSKNAGAPLHQFEFTVQEPKEVDGYGKVEGRKLWSNMMPTVSATLFNLKGFLGALGYDVEGKLDYNPTRILAAPFEERLLVVKVVIQGPRQDPRDPSKTYDARNEIKAYFPAESWDGVKASATNESKSLLP